MTPRELNQNYQKKKDIFHKYIDTVKKNAKWNLFTIINSTLIKNPYSSSFSKNIFQIY